MKKNIFSVILLIFFLSENVFSQTGDKKPESSDSGRSRLQLPDVESILDKLDFGIIKKVDLKEKTVYVRDNFHIKWGIPPGIIDQAQPFPNYNPYVRISLAGKSRNEIFRRSSFFRPMGNIKIGRKFSSFSVEGGFRLDYIRVRQFNTNGKDMDEKEQKKVIIPALFVNVGLKF